MAQDSVSIEGSKFAKPAADSWRKGGLKWKISSTFSGLIFVLGLLFVAVRMFARNRRGRTFGLGPGAAGSVYDMLNEDKRKALEIIVEGRAEHRDPETADDVPPRP